MSPPRPAPVPVALEAGTRRVFAFALDWPGWCRSGRDEAKALEALAAAAARYAPVAARAGAPFPGAAAGFEVVERLTGNATTDFGAPGAVAAADRRALTAAGARRLAALVDAAGAEFDGVAAGAPALLRKGPRGGGRDREAIVAHVAEAAAAYARRLGIRPGRGALSGSEAVADLRRAVIAGLARRPSGRPRGRPGLAAPLRGAALRLARARPCLGDRGPLRLRGARRRAPRVMRPQWCSAARASAFVLWMVPAGWFGGE